eukprot:COSAG06_NODE_5713_length_3309_cov_17.587539_1_plen_201_part_10
MEPAAEPPHHQRLEQLERAVQEIEALEAIYGFEPGGFTVHSEAELLAARTVLDDVAFSGGSAPAAAAAGASQQLEVELQISLDDVLNAPRARLRCRLPPGYPDTAASVSAVSIAGLHRTAADGLSIKLSEKALALAGDEAVMELVQNLQEIAPAAFEAAASDSHQGTSSTGGAGAAATRGDRIVPTGMGRRWIWAHHIKDT